MPGQTPAAVRYTVEPDYEAWVIPEGPLPESTGHAATTRALHDVLESLVRERGLPYSVERSLALRWIQPAPRTGIDPDLCLVTPPIGREVDLGSARLWEPEAPRPTLCVEVVSRGHPYKDYGIIQDRYAALGVPELWVVDPWLHGPRAGGGPVSLQLWLPVNGVFERSYFGPGPIESPFLNVWIHVDTREHWVRLCRDAEGSEPYLTVAEAADLRARSAEDRAHSAEDRARSAEDRARSAETEARALRERLEHSKR